MLVAPVHRSDIAVCGSRDVSLPRINQRRRQKDEETHLTWYLKDEVMRRGRDTIHPERVEFNFTPSA